MDCSELLRRVRVVINEAVNDDDVALLSVDTRSLDDSIMELLPRAVSLVQKNRGSKRVNSRVVDIQASDIIPDGSGCGLLALPDDFVDLVSLHLTGWESPVCRLSAHNSREAIWQRNMYTRAGCCRPVCIEAFATNGARMAMLCPFPEGDDGAPVHFIYEAAFNAEDGLDGYDDGMPDAVVYACASLLYSVFERYDAANAMLSLALAACGGSVNGKQ